MCDFSWGLKALEMHDPGKAKGDRVGDSTLVHLADTSRNAPEKLNFLPSTR